MSSRKLICCQLHRGPLGTMLLTAWDDHRREPFRAQAFASRANDPQAHWETCWTDAGTVKCAGRIQFPRTAA
jgi:hypothetical protein